MLGIIELSFCLASRLISDRSVLSVPVIGKFPFARKLWTPRHLKALPMYQLSLILSGLFLTY